LNEAPPEISIPALARTPQPPYYAVVFTSVRRPTQAAEYAAMSDRMVELAAAQPGFLGVESVHDHQGTGITVSYWASLEAIRNWRDHAEHRVAQSQGRDNWYREYRLRVCHVACDLHFISEENG
jgi:heme-degrading monooxygenase HmoA